MKTVDKIRLAVAILLVGTVGIFLTVHIVKTQQMKEALIKANIYEIGSAFDAYDSDIRVRYMVCDPDATQAEANKQIEEFILKNHIVDQLIDRSRKIGKEQFRWVNLTFIKPTEHWQIGQFYDDEEQLLLYPDMVITCVTIDLHNPDEMEFHHRFVNAGN